jgi:hypothetical protein
MMRLRSTTLLSLVSQPIDLPSPGMQIPTISHPMTELPPDVLSLICSSLLPRGGVPFPESTTTSLFLPSLTARRLPSHLPRLGRGVSSASSPTLMSDPGNICRDRYKSAKRELYRVGWSQQTLQREHRRNCRHEDIFGQGRASPFSGHPQEG